MSSLLDRIVDEEARISQMGILSTRLILSPEGKKILAIELSESRAFLIALNSGSTLLGLRIEFGSYVTSLFQLKDDRGYPRSRH